MRTKSIKQKCLWTGCWPHCCVSFLGAWLWQKKTLSWPRQLGWRKYSTVCAVRSWSIKVRKDCVYSTKCKCKTCRSVIVYKSLYRQFCPMLISREIQVNLSQSFSWNWYEGHFAWISPKMQLAVYSTSGHSTRWSFKGKGNGTFEVLCVFQIRMEEIRSPL